MTHAHLAFASGFQAGLAASTYVAPARFPAVYHVGFDAGTKARLRSLDPAVAETAAWEELKGWTRRALEREDWKRMEREDRKRQSAP